MEEIRTLQERLEQERPAEWDALPDIGLYMDQLISYMPRQLIHYGEGEALTSAMVNNYIKDGALPRADGKRYSRTHLAYLTAICALKQVLSVKDAGALLAAAREGREPEGLYELFRQELDRALDVRRAAWTRGPTRRICPGWPWPWPCAAMPTSWPASACWRSCAGMPARPPSSPKRPEGRKTGTSVRNEYGRI